MASTKKSIDIMSLIVLLGGVLAIVGFFLTVCTINIDLIITDSTVTLNGSQVMDFNIQGHKADLTAMAYMPVLALVFGVLTILVSILPMFVKIDAKIASVLQLLFGLLTAVFALVFVFSGCGPGLFAGDWNTAIQAAVDSGIVKFSAGAGAYLPAVGGILAFLGGAVNLKKSL